MMEDDRPLIVNKPFLEEKKYKWFGKKVPKLSLREPILILGDSLGDWKIIEGVGTGRYKVSEGQSIYLDPAKLGRLNYGDESWKCFIAHVDYPVALPPDCRHLTETVNTAIMQSVINHRMLEENSGKLLSAKMGAYIKMAIGIVVVAVLAGGVLMGFNII